MLYQELARTVVPVTSIHGVFALQQERPAQPLLPALSNTRASLLPPLPAAQLVAVPVVPAAGSCQQLCYLPRKLDHSSGLGCWLLSLCLQQ